jgi:hypothetical protein
LLSRGDDSFPFVLLRASCIPDEYHVRKQNDVSYRDDEIEEAQNRKIISPDDKDYCPIIIVLSKNSDSNAREPALTFGHGRITTRLTCETAKKLAPGDLKKCFFEQTVLKGQLPLCCLF